MIWFAVACLVITIFLQVKLHRMRAERLRKTKQLKREIDQWFNEQRGTE